MKIPLKKLIKNNELKFILLFYHYDLRKKGKKKIEKFYG